jgi:hypothetical protein
MNQQQPNAERDLKERVLEWRKRYVPRALVDDLEKISDVPRRATT